MPFSLRLGTLGRWPDWPSAMHCNPNLFRMWYHQKIVIQCTPNLCKMMLNSDIVFLFNWWIFEAVQSSAVQCIHTCIHVRLLGPWDENRNRALLDIRVLSRTRRVPDETCIRAPAILRETSAGTSYLIVRLVFRPYTQFHVLLNSLFKVLFNYPSRYLFAIGLGVVFSLTRSSPRTLGCTPKQPDSREKSVDK